MDLRSECQSREEGLVAKSATRLQISPVCCKYPVQKLSYFKEAHKNSYSPEERKEEGGLKKNKKTAMSQMEGAIATAISF